MVDPVVLAFIGLLEDLRIQRLGGWQVGTERLFDDDAPENLVVLLEQTRTPEPVHHRAEKPCAHGKVENRAAVAQGLADLLENLVLAKIALLVGQPLGHPPPGSVVDLWRVELRRLVGGEALHGVRQVVLPALGVELSAIHPDHPEPLCK